MVVQVRDNVWWMNFLGVNAYLVDDGDDLTLVDAGLPWHAGRITDAVETLGWRVEDIDRVLITHYDTDHVGSLSRLGLLDATVFIGREDRPYLTGAEKPSLNRRKEILQRAVGWLHGPPATPIEPVDNGDRIGSFTAYSASGHTPGHRIYVSEALSVAFLGDLVMGRGGRLVPVPGFICHDKRQAQRDIVSIADRLPPFESACPGHGVPLADDGDQLLRDCATRVDDS